MRGDEKMLLSAAVTGLAAHGFALNDPAKFVAKAKELAKAAAAGLDDDEPQPRDTPAARRSR